jgi:cobalt-zinc-cadmium efflux system protein
VVLEHLSHAKPSALFTYGYRRFAVLGGLITGLILLVGVIVVAWRAVHRLLEPEEVNAPGMIVFGLLGVIVNGAALLRLRHGKSLNTQIVSWHFLEDTLGWIAILLGTIALLIWHMPIVDPILSIGISLFVLFNVGRNLRRVVLVFLQTVPPGFDVDAFQRGARKISRVVSTHHMHSWSIDGDRHGRRGGRGFSRRHARARSRDRSAAKSSGAAPSRWRRGRSMHRAGRPAGGASDRAGNARR